MRAINDLKDVQLVLNGLNNFVDKFNSKSIDRKGLKFTNNGPATDPGDYVILSQLPSLVNTSNDNEQHYTAVFSDSGVVGTGDVVPAFIAGFERVGFPVAVNMVVHPLGSAPSTGDLTINIFVGRNISGIITGQNILKTDLTLPQGTFGPVSASNFIQNVPYVGDKFVVYPVITNGAGAAVVTIGVVLRRSKNAGA